MFRSAPILASPEVSLDGFHQLLSVCPDNDLLHVYTGNLYKTLQLFSIPMVGPPLEFRLTHNSRSPEPLGDVGLGWRHSGQARLQRATSTATTVTFTDKSGRKFDFTLVSGVWQLSGSTFENMILTDLGSGVWQLRYDPSGEVLRFTENGGTPIVAPLTSESDGNGNSVSYVYTSGQLTAIRDVTSNREITLTWLNSKISSVTDPKGNAYTLTYTSNLLTAVEMPDGCRLEYTYTAQNLVATRTDRASASTLYTYDTSGRLTQYEGALVNNSRPTLVYSYPSTQVSEVLSHDGATGGNRSFRQVLLTDARGKNWEYRFNTDGTLWRRIDPAGQHRRCYYDSNQQLLYESTGFERKNLDDGTTPTKFGPRDNINNQFRRFVTDVRGNTLQEIDANGLATAYRYDSQSRPASIYPGQAHFGLGGNWRGHFGQDGFIFCAYNEDGTDRRKLPTYLNSLSPVLAGDGVNSATQHTAKNANKMLNSTDYTAVLVSDQVLEGVVPAEGDRFTQARGIGVWYTPSNRVMSFRVQLSTAKAFNLSLYTHALDQIDHQFVSANGNLVYPELFGRDIEFHVTDLRGTQKFHVMNNASGVWVTFPVQGDANNPILVTAVCNQTNHRPAVSALCFDPFEDRRTLISYDSAGNLTKLTQPSANVAEEIAGEQTFNSNGTVSQAKLVRRLNGVLTDSRTYNMTYGDAAKNLTRLEDPLNLSAAPTLFAYDLNNNLTSFTDPDNRTTVLSYDYRNRLTRVENDLAEATVLTYDGRGLLTQFTDAENRATVLTYTAGRNLWKITNELQEVTEFSYLADGLLASIKDARANVVSFEYDNVGNLTKVNYPGVDVVHSDFSRTLLTPELRLAYDVWRSVVAATSPNGNQSQINQINVAGALNVLRNGGAEVEDAGKTMLLQGVFDDGWVYGQTSAEKREGDFSFNNTYDSNELEFKRVESHPGSRYLARGSIKHAVAGATLTMTAIVRQMNATLAAQTTSTGTATNGGAWNDLLLGRFDTPGDAQVSRDYPVLHSVRANVTCLPSTYSNIYADELKVQNLSTAFHYDGENLNALTAPDGGQVQLARDRFGRPRKWVDPQNRVVEFSFDALDRLVSVKDSQGLTLAYAYDFLGNLTEFTDSRGKITVFSYDTLNRLTEIEQPVSSQVESFTYSAAGDLKTYVNARGQEREFFYDAAHRLIRVDYKLTPPLVESVHLTYDKVGNLLTLTERNGDQLVFTYDVLHRLKTSRRVPATGSSLPAWSHQHTYDANGNRTGLANYSASSSVYGTAIYGTSVYAAGGSSSDIVRTPLGGVDALNRRTAFEDAQSNVTSFGYDIDGRLAEVVHPNGSPALKTRNRYDLVGRLLEANVTQSSTELWGLGYTYNQASDRLGQVSRWSGGGNSFDYVLDRSGRLAMETINRLVVWTADQVAQGALDRLDFDSEGTLKLLAHDDTFAGSELRLQRWDPGVSILAVQATPRGGDIRQSDGLHIASSRGFSSQLGRYQPAGYVAGNGGIADYPDYTPIPIDYTGRNQARFLVRHRQKLEGAFSVEVNVSDMQLNGAAAFGVTIYPFNPNIQGLKYPNLGASVQTNGASALLYYNGSNRRLQFNNVAVAASNVTKLRLERLLLSGAWNLKLSYYDGSAWQTHASWTAGVGSDPMHAYFKVHAEDTIASIRFSDYKRTVGPQHQLSTISGTESVNQSAWPKYVSAVYDAGRAVDWTAIRWVESLATNTDVRLQVAVSSSPSGPWNYVGPGNSASAYFTNPSGETLPTLNGRYCRFRAFLYSTDGAATPTLSRVQISHAGSGGSMLMLYEYDNAGNRTLKTTITDAGTVTDQSTSINDLNQIITRVLNGVTWNYVYDLDGNLVEKNNGTALGNEKWQYTWNEDNRLTQVTRGIWVTGPVLSNLLTVSYQYDIVGRLLRRVSGSSVTTFEWDGWVPIGETTGSVVTRWNAPEGILLSFERGGSVYQCHYDALGSVRAVTDSSGAVVARFDYDAWGNLLPGGSDNVPGVLLYRFVGGLGCRLDPDTGFVYMRNRWYDPQLHRFISRDPIGLNGGANLYAYAGCQPNTYVDSGGAQPTGPGWIKPWGSDTYLNTNTGERFRKVNLPEPAEPNVHSRESLENFLGHPMPLLTQENAQKFGSLIVIGFTLRLVFSGSSRRGFANFQRRPEFVTITKDCPNATRLQQLPQSPREFLFDGEKLVVALKRMKHERLAQKSRIDSKNRRPGGGEIRTEKGWVRSNENSGSFHQNWTDELRQELNDFMNKHNIPFRHIPGTEGQWH